MHMARFEPTSSSIKLLIGVFDIRKYDVHEECACVGMAVSSSQVLLTVV